MKELKAEVQKQAAAKAKAISKIQELKDKYTVDQRKLVEKEEKEKEVTEVTSRMKTEIYARREREKELEKQIQELSNVQKNKIEVKERKNVMSCSHKDHFI